MSKYEDTRIVTFKEDYGVPKVDKDGKPVLIDGKPTLRIYYKKDSQHAIHYKVVGKLEERGAKLKVERFDRKAYVEREKEKLLKRDKSSISMERR
jgi:hypothetical protein